MKLLAILCLITFGVSFARTPQIAESGGGGKTGVQVVEPKPVPVALSADDQKVLEQLTGQINRMQPELASVEKQQAQAQALLAQANLFITQYNQLQANRQAFLFRVAADICKCSTAELEFAPDGKSVVRKKPEQKP